MASTADSSRSKKECESHMLWYLNSRGCIREVVTDFYQSQADPREVSEDGQPCCDRCFRKFDFNPDSWIGYPVRYTTPFQSTCSSEDIETLKNIETTADVVSSPKISADSTYRICLAVRLALECHRSILVLSQNDLLEEKHLLPDAWIDLAALKALSIQSVEDLKNLSRKFPLGEYTAIGNGLPQVLSVIQDTISKADAPQYALRISGTAYTVLPEKPLYDAGQIMQAPPTIAEKMKAANDELREVDLEAWEKKEKVQERRTEALRKSQSQREATRAYNRQSQGGSQSVQQSEASELPTLPDKRKEAPVASTPTAPKRKRGRPLGSKNKPKRLE